ncbi:MAG: hypothetical protein LUG54_01720 [Clostridiales bacterium]|nr:hypothetical protein [Clostridiales bacterium]
MKEKIKNFRLKKLAAGIVAASMSVTLIAGTAFAADYGDYVPTETKTVTSSAVTGATAAANTVALSVLGIDVAATNGAGIYNAGGSTDDYGKDSANLGIFGTDLNDKADPYLYNFYYNLANSESNTTYTLAQFSGDYDYSVHSLWSAVPYTLLWNSNKSGPTGQASGTTYISVGSYGAKTTNPAFYYEPDILLGGSTNGYASELANYQAAYNSSYNPTVFLGYGTSTGMYAANGSRSDGLGLEYNQFDMCTGLVYLGSVVQNLVNTSTNNETTRYDQGAYEIAVNYDKYDRGLYYYVLSEIADGSLTQVRYASSLSYDEDTEMYTVKCGTSRAAQYASGIGQDIYELLEDGYTFSDESSYTQSGSSYLLTLNQLIEILNAPTTGEDASTDATGIIIGSEVSDVDTEAGDLAAAGIRGLDDLPECVYGMTMQTVENGMGIPFYIGYFYYNQDSSLNPANYIAYWIANFYHVSNTTNMQIIFNQMMADADSPDGLNYAKYVISSDSDGTYSDSTVESQILEGIAYYTETLEEEYEDMVEDGEIDSDSALFWTSLDENVGIGSSAQNTSSGYTCTVASSFTDDFGNTIYKYTFTAK